MLSACCHYLGKTGKLQMGATLRIPTSILYQPWGILHGKTITSYCPCTQPSSLGLGDPLESLPFSRDLLEVEALLAGQRWEVWGVCWGLSLPPDTDLELCCICVLLLSGQSLLLVFSPWEAGQVPLSPSAFLCYGIFFFML